MNSVLSDLSLLVPQFRVMVKACLELRNELSWYVCPAATIDFLDSNPGLTACKLCFLATAVHS